MLTSKTGDTQIVREVDFFELKSETHDEICKQIGFHLASVKLSSILHEDVLYRTLSNLHSLFKYFMKTLSVLQDIIIRIVIYGQYCSPLTKENVELTILYLVRFDS